MKKKILLLAVMIAVLSCLFVVSANADTLVPFDSNEYGEISVVDGVPEPTVIDKNAKTVIVANEKYYTIPTYYLLADNSFFTWNVHANVKAAFGLGSDVRGNLVRVEIPEGIVTSYNGGSGGLKMESSSKLIEASIPTTMEIMGDFFFGKCTALTTVNGLENSKVDGIYKQAFYNTKITSIALPSTVKTIGQDAFRNAPITSIVIPNSVESIGDHAFASCTSLATISISENSKLKRFDGQYQFEQTAISNFYFPSSLESIGTGGAFYKCSSLETLVNFENTKITDIPFRTFSGGPKFTTITFPQGIVSIGDNAFNGHKITGDIIIPNTVTSLGDHAFAGSNVNCGKLVLGSGLTTITGTYTFEKTDFSAVYIPSGITAFPQGAFKETGDNGGAYYYTGTLEQLNALKANTVTGDNGNFLNADVIYGYNVCDAFYASKHLEDNNPCVINCDRCNVNGVAEENPVHNIATTITYVSFDTIGTKKIGCTNEGCSHGTTEEAPALFVNLGFSASEYDGTQISVNYKVNAQAVKDYEDATGEKLNYGVFAVRADRIETNDIFDADGKALDGVIAADITGSGYTLFNLKITGFTSEQKDIDLAMGAYVGTTKEEKTTYSYLQIAAPTNGKYYCASYNDVVELLEGKESAQ